MIEIIYSEFCDALFKYQKGFWWYGNRDYCYDFKEAPKKFEEFLKKIDFVPKKFPVYVKHDDLINEFGEGVMLKGLKLERGRFFRVDRFLAVCGKPPARDNAYIYGVFTEEYEPYNYATPARLIAEALKDHGYEYCFMANYSFSFSEIVITFITSRKIDKETYRGIMMISSHNRVFALRVYPVAVREVAGEFYPAPIAHIFRKIHKRSISAPATEKAIEYLVENLDVIDEIVKEMKAKLLDPLKPDDALALSEIRTKVEKELGKRLA
ncbi:MAG: hypothetical protein DRP01_08840, partial [Archaeoglobales archaeon]